MSLVIRTPCGEERPALRSLWQAAFGDPPEDVDFFFTHADGLRHGLCAYEGEALAGCLFLLPAQLCVAGASFDACYVYAVATVPEYRGRGVMRALEGAAAEHLKKGGVHAMALVPASPGLFGMYQKLGYRTRFYQTRTTLAPALLPSARLLPCEKAAFLSLRRAMLRERGTYFDLYPALCEYRYDDFLRSGGAIWRLEGERTGYLACRKEGEACRILETDLSGEALSQAAGAALEMSGTRSVTLDGGGGLRRPYGMIKYLDSFPGEDPLYRADAYMNLMLN